MRIESIECRPFKPRYRGKGFSVSYGHLTELDHRLLMVQLAGGPRGWGEIVRLPAKDSTAAAEVEDRWLPRLQGLDLDALPALVREVRGEGSPARGLSLAIETAMLDLVGQITEMPMSALLGGPPRGDVPALLGLSCEKPEEVAGEIRASGAPHRMIQGKMGVGEIAEDLDRTRAALDALRPDQIFLADFNGVLDLDTALDALPGLHHPALIWEEPCRTLDENIELAKALETPVLFDQCIDGLEPLGRAIAAGVAAGVSVKPFYMGGLGPARAARDMCNATGTRMRIDGPWSGQVANAASLHLALGADPELLMFSGDLTGPLETASGLIRHPAPGRVAPAPGPGLGTVGLDLWQQETT